MKLRRGIPLKENMQSAANAIAAAVVIVVVYISCGHNEKCAT